MSKTLSDLRASVHLNTGRGVDKADLINNLLNQAIDVAVNKYPFRHTVATTDIALVENATSHSLSALTGLAHVVYALIYETAGTRYQKLTMKDNIWWNRSVIDASRNNKGWPVYVYRDTTTLYFDRPLESGLTLRIATSRIPSMTSDASVFSIPILETFIVQYATALLFLSLENVESYNFWKSIALGPQWDIGIVGGSLKHAIDSDSYDIAEEFKVELDLDNSNNVRGVSILNNDDVTPHDDYGSVRTWY
jgi:hypothetical protein